MADRDLGDVHGGGRRRVAARASVRPSPLTILALAIPLLTVAALALVRPAVVPLTTQASSDAELDRSSRVCPSSLPGAERVIFGHTGLASGTLALRVSGEDDTVDLATGIATRDEPAAVTATGEGNLAPGLVLTRAGAGAAVRCTEPSPEQWFTGVGAAAEHSSNLTLTNPDKGPAVADVTVHDGAGIVDVPGLRGIRVPGGRSMSFDLAEVVPSRDALAMRVSVTRGRLGASVVDTIDPLGRSTKLREWLPSQPAPTESSYFVGLGTTPGDRVLTVANPGDSEAQVDLKLVSQDSEFTPKGIKTLRVAPASVRELDLSQVLRGKLAEGVEAVRLDASAPVTSSLRTRTARDLALVSAAPPITSAGVALPSGPARIVVAGATAAGEVTVQAWDKRGAEVVGMRRVEITPETATRINLPDTAVLALIEVEGAKASISVEMTSPGLSVVPLDELLTTSQLPDVRPAPR